MVVGIEGSVLAHMMNSLTHNTIVIFWKSDNLISKEIYN